MSSGRNNRAFFIKARFVIWTYLTVYKEFATIGSLLSLSPFSCFVSQTFLYGIQGFVLNKSLAFRVAFT
jgi:hypothetical protein